MNELGNGASDHYDEVSPDTIVEWLNNPTYLKILIITGIVYEILRVVLTALITFLLSPALIVTVLFFESSGNGTISGVEPYYPTVSSVEDFAITWMLFAVALTILIIEYFVSIQFEIQRPISKASIHIVYYLGIIGGNVYSLLIKGEYFDRHLLMPFKNELLGNRWEIESLVYLFIRENGDFSPRQYLDMSEQ